MSLSFVLRRVPQQKCHESAQMSKSIDLWPQGIKLDWLAYICLFSIICFFCALNTYLNMLIFNNENFKLSMMYNFWNIKGNKMWLLIYYVLKFTSYYTQINKTLQLLDKKWERFSMSVVWRYNMLFVINTNTLQTKVV